MIEEGKVKIWIGVSSEKRMDELIEDFSDDEESDCDDENKPINKLAEALGIGFYDHDFLEQIVIDKKAPQFQDFVNTISFSEQLQHILKQDFKILKGSNTVLAFYSEPDEKERNYDCFNDFPNKDIKAEGVDLRFIGCFDLIDPKHQKKQKKRTATLFDKQNKSPTEEVGTNKRVTRSMTR